ncbi:hypothetical protein HPB52_019282 [Rhipicephalus sanguineus]|uniref:Uncharacterized protein n=1 Tax=Rhipicephalus sanguineus TaxID=34632 RepID=A0A9D4PN16_RHISA|nr:hypothetical protein HPB52_019282 [Rhipicephalus sanguineus]
MLRPAPNPRPTGIRIAASPRAGVPKPVQYPVPQPHPIHTVTEVTNTAVVRPVTHTGYGGLGGLFGGFPGYGDRSLGSLFGRGAYPGFYGATTLNLIGNHNFGLLGRYPPPPGLGAVERRGRFLPHPVDIRTTTDPVTGHPMVQAVYFGNLRERIVPVPIPIVQDVPYPVPVPVPQPYPVPRPVTFQVPVPVAHPVPVHTNTEVHKTDVVAATPQGAVLLDRQVTGIRPGATTTV